MNRKQRRQQRRQHGRHLDCGCTTRVLVPVERVATCTGCGAVSPALPDFPMPTSAPVGSLTSLMWGCAGCGREVEVPCLVQ